MAAIGEDEVILGNHFPMAHRIMVQPHEAAVDLPLTSGGGREDMGERLPCTYINGFLDLEYPNFDPKHGFLSSVDAEIISFFQRRQPFAFSAFYIHPLIFEGGSPSKFHK